MRRGRLLWTFFPPLLIILITALVLVTGFAGRSMRGFFLDRTAKELEDLAALSGPRLAPLVAADDEAAVQALCLKVGELTDSRLTVVLGDGRVIGDSEQDPSIMDNHRDRPEIVRAFAGGVGTSTRYSSTLGHQRMYVAVPVVPSPEGGGGIFVVRASVSLASLASLMRQVYLKITLTGLILTVLAGFTSFLLSRSLSRTLGQLQAGAESFAAGRLENRLHVGGSSEIAAVAEAMNRMAIQLGERIGTIDRQRREMEAVLTSMVEGVLAVDTEETVIGLNQAGANLLGADLRRFEGRSIQEVGRHPDLTGLVQQVLAGAGPLERDVLVGSSTDRWLQVHATGLVGVDGRPIGALLVMNDVTRLRKLENIRRDFVANVSHELKTPITSIKGYVETLLEAPPAERGEMERFLGIINRQADRLAAIIGDLLSLSRLEHYADSDGLERDELPLVPVLERVVRDLGCRWPDAGRRVTLRSEGSPRAPVNAPLLEQAVGNLLDNALKYSPDDEPVVLACAERGGRVVITVADRGPGIAAEHLPRLFERFYRVDKARSRQMGGTGLGLAIVKHIAQAHGGRVTVDSAPGEGTTFTMDLPRVV